MPLKRSETNTLHTPTYTQQQQQQHHKSVAIAFVQTLTCSEHAEIMKAFRAFCYA